MATGFALIAVQGVQGTAHATDSGAGLTVSMYGNSDTSSDCDPEQGPRPPECTGAVILLNSTTEKAFTVYVNSGPGGAGAHAAAVEITFGPQQIAAAGFTSAADFTTRLTATAQSGPDQGTDVAVPWTVAADGSASLELPAVDIPGGTSVSRAVHLTAAYSIKEGTLSGSVAVTDDQHNTSTSPVDVTFYKRLTSNFFGRTSADNGTLFRYDVGGPFYGGVAVGYGNPVGTRWDESTALIRLGEPRNSVQPGQYILDRTSDGFLYVHKPTATGYDTTKVGWNYNVYDMFAAAGDITGDGAFDFVTRSAEGVLWRYDGLPGDTGFAARQQIGWGWGIYDKVIGGGDLDKDGHADLLARDSTGNLWYYAGTGQPAAPFAPRVKIGWGWNAYDQIMLIGPCDYTGNACLVARDAAGKLWGYQSTGTAHPAVTGRTQVGYGYTIYNTMF